ncbi:TPA: cell division protein FtsN, partial [Neisseria meningitidis]
MSENKQNEVLSGYEQLKRRNRRRLVTASCLVAASCILLAAALSSGPAEQTAGETSGV